MDRRLTQDHILKCNHAFQIVGLFVSNGIVAVCKYQSEDRDKVKPCVGTKVWPGGTVPVMWTCRKGEKGKRWPIGSGPKATWQGLEGRCGNGWKSTSQCSGSAHSCYSSSCLFACELKVKSFFNILVLIFVIISHGYDKSFLYCSDLGMWWHGYNRNERRKNINC